VVPLPRFELCCIAVVILTLVVMSRTTPRRRLLVEYATLAVAGYLGEESCIALYRFYAYAPGWHARIDHVPLLVPLIWPLVILSARDVIGCLAPSAGRGQRAVLVGALVCLDASLVEVVAVRAGLWTWAEPGHLDVPLIGILGWGFFAAGAELALSWRSSWRHLALLLGAPAFTHLCLVASWWAALRWTLRGDLGHGSLAGILVVGVLATAAAVGARRAGHAIAPEVALPRVVAAGLFLTLLATTAPAEIALWLHVAAVAVPYLAATRFRASRSEGAPA
jgi:hypothetical protein